MAHYKRIYPIAREEGGNRSTVLQCSAEVSERLGKIYPETFIAIELFFDKATSLCVPQEEVVFEHVLDHLPEDIRGIDWNAAKIKRGLQDKRWYVQLEA